MKTSLLLCLCLWLNITYAQSLDQYIIGSAGSFASTTNNSTLSWTLGEPITSTESSNSAILTQGFQQIILVNPMSTNNFIQQDFQLQVYPNPTAEQISIDKNQDEVLEATLINVLGQVIEQYTLTDNNTTINIAKFPAANYLLRISNSENQTIQTFKIQKIQ